MSRDPQAMLGSGEPSEVFPLLVKIIDAKQRLSVQVHPNDESAAAYGGEAKTEMWYVLASDPGAQVYAGLKPGTTPERFRRALEEVRLEELLTAIPANPGEAIFIPGGCVHAICQGCLLLEIQQNSNTTYRVYDWGRMGKDGKPRPLHVEQAFQVIDWDRSCEPIRPGTPVDAGPNAHRRIVKSPYFEVTRLDLGDQESVTHGGESFHILFVANGTVDITGDWPPETLTPGTSCLVPAAARDYALVPGDKATVLRITR
jgi:mannose-6-phosphate isomerase